MRLRTQNRKRSQWKLSTSEGLLRSPSSVFPHSHLPSRGQALSSAMLGTTKDVKARQKTRFSEMRKVPCSGSLPQACSSNAGDVGVARELPEHPLTLTGRGEMGIMHSGNPGDMTVNSFTLKVEQICPK
ncbi:unnamed protein product [Gulo gulo]|uniref:Uncharacterized protein n=1 Tax=Gulo gulo TaxID=48420 RepID=A0A9X9Q2E4_GULGU|nr:unnamed protein product [Gulo gulo]